MTALARPNEPARPVARVASTMAPRMFVLRTEEHARRLWVFLKANWRACAANDAPLAITVATHKSKRSLEQNRRLWALYGEIAASAWVDGKQFSAEAWHELLKGEILGYVDLPFGRRMPMSTAGLDVEQFAQYMQRVEAFAVTQLGVEFVEILDR